MATDISKLEEKEKITETIRKLHARQVPISSIASACNLSISEVENILKEIYSKSENPEVFVAKSIDTLTEIQADLNKIIYTCDEELKKKDINFAEKEKAIRLMLEVLRFKSELEDKKMNLMQSVFGLKGKRAIIFKETSRPFGLSFTIAEIREKLKEFKTAHDKQLYLLSLLGYTNDTINQITEAEKEFILELTESTKESLDTTLWRIANMREKIPSTKTVALNQKTKGKKEKEITSFLESESS
jgi:hypothetical protein